MQPRSAAIVLFVSFLAACGPMSSTPQSPPTATSLAGRITFAGSTTIQPLADKLGQAFKQHNPGVTLDIAAGGSVVGIQAIHAGTVDLGMASRALTSDEAQGITPRQIAVDVIAIVVHPSNPVKSLTMDQLRGIYMGKTTDWSEVGGQSRPIVAVVREKNSGTRGAFNELVLDNQEPAAPSVQTAVTAGDVAAAVAGNPAAIGYVGFGNLESSLRVVAIDGVLPTEETAQSGAYRLVRPLFLLAGPLTQPLALTFVDFTLGAEGQQIVKANGWVPVK
jgi:phosphate transport system substrate-binding protein